MSFVIFIYVVILFMLLTPGVLVMLPPGGDKMTVTLVHALIFGIIFSMMHGTIMNLSSGKSYYHGDKMMADDGSCNKKSMYMY